ncbi:MAG: cyclic nucleotide-binding domain-containing protein [Chloroflexota bacterium]|nr:cyclic nucleotide-binding domain-containing protein [Chloroflexota bacterium]
MHPGAGHHCYIVRGHAQSRADRIEEATLDQDEQVDLLAGLTLFGDLGPAQLAEAAHTFSEESYPAGQRILRQGFTGTGFYVILEGEVAVRIDGEDRARLGKGDFFGEMALLLAETPVADVVALGPVRTLHLAGGDLRDFLLRHPSVMYHVLQTVARRLRNANRRQV